MVQSPADLTKIAGHAIARNTLKGLQVASARSGVDFQYLVAKAAQESSLQTDAQARTSSATGLFQFTKGTWLDISRHGPNYGLGALARQIEETASGALKVKDAAAERRILAMREDPETSALMAAAYARDNAAALRGSLDRDVDAADLYLAHFLGSTGATQLLGAATQSPQTPAAHILPEAAKANASVFYAPDGRARSAAEVVQLVRGRFTDQMNRYADLAAAVAAEEQERAAAKAAAAPANPFAHQGVRQLDLAHAMASGDPNRMSVSWMILEEMARLIASTPMVMRDEDESEEERDAMQPLSASGFHGQDWSAALVNQSLKSARATPAPEVQPVTGARAYDFLQTMALPMAPAVLKDGKI